MPHTEIAIVGAGIGGCIAAIALSKHYQVTLIDKHAQPIPRVGECLPPAARRILHSLSLLPEFEASNHITSLGMRSYWGSEQLQYVDNLANPDGFGWHLDREAFERQLRRAAQVSGVVLVAPMQLESSAPLVDESEQGWQLTLASSQERMVLTADVVIDATGRHCTFARQRGMTRKQFDKLVSCWMVVDRAPEKMMGLIAPSHNGWWYAAPMATSKHGQCKQVLSFQTDADLLPKGVGSNAHAFIAEVPELGEFKRIVDGVSDKEFQWHGKVAANSSVLTAVAGKGWFALGDSALSFDPLSSQGMFNTMATAMQLSDLLIEKGLFNSQAGQEYTQQIQKILHYYQQHKALYYRQEQRWHTQDFWARRK